MNNKGLTLQRKIKKVFSVFHRRKLKNRTFSLISNNCFSGIIYDRYGLQYRSPTIAFSMSSKDYLKFLSNLDFYLEQEIKSIPDRSTIKNIDFFNHYNLDINKALIGKLYDLELNLLHYSSIEEANEKYKKRAKRVNKDNLVVKFNDQNLATLEDMNEFLNLPYKNKILFTCHPYFKNSNNPNVYYFSKYKNKKEIKNDLVCYKRYINITKYLNDIQ